MDKKYEFENIYFNDKSTAKYILRQMKEHIENVGSVLVWELYEFAEIRDIKDNYDYELYGWINLNNVDVKTKHIINYYGGTTDLYYIDLPEPDYISVNTRVILEDGRI